MIITKNLTRTLFIATFIMLTITNYHQLHAMKPEKIKTCEEILLDADFQAYKLFSTLNNDDLWYLPYELIKIITANMFKFIDKECYENYGKHLTIPDALFMFIVDKQRFMSDISVANAIKRCLRCSGKSLDNIKNSDDSTIFHVIIESFEGSNYRVQWTKIALLIAEKTAWNIICMKNKNGRNAILEAVTLRQNDSLFISELLSAAPNSQDAWKAINTREYSGVNALDKAKAYGSLENVQLLESYRPKEQ